MIEKADEIKLLFDGSDWWTLPKEVQDHPLVFVSPINPVGTDDTGITQQLSLDNLHKVLLFLTNRPDWRLSVQLHKYLGLR